MKNFLRILIINIALLFVPISTYATIAVKQKTEASSHKEWRKVKSDKSQLDGSNGFAKGALVTGLLSAFGGGVLLSLVSTAGFFNGLLMLIAGVSLLAVGCVFLLGGGISWLFGRSRKQGKVAK